MRYYVDGETTASIAFAPGMAAGVGFGDDGAPRGTKWYATAVCVCAREKWALTAAHRRRLALFLGLALAPAAAAVALPTLTTSVSPLACVAPCPGSCFWHSPLLHLPTFFATKCSRLPTHTRPFPFFFLSFRRASESPSSTRRTTSAGST